MEKTYKYYTDDAHGWVEVQTSELFSLGIADKMSQYSYVNGTKVYLEEDRDAGIFISAMKDKGFTVNLSHKTHKGQSRIRRYTRFASNLWVLGLDC